MQQRSGSQEKSKNLQREWQSVEDFLWMMQEGFQAFMGYLHSFDSNIRIQMVVLVYIN
jgi:hypothetical protein